MKPTAGLLLACATMVLVGLPALAMFVFNSLTVLKDATGQGAGWQMGLVLYSAAVFGLTLWLLIAHVNRARIR